jgi:hypothetical protein
MTGSPGEPAKFGVAVTDLVAGMMAATAVLAAYIQRLGEVLVVRGAGDHFCAGADTSEVETRRATAEAARLYGEHVEYAASGASRPGPRCHRVRPQILRHGQALGEQVDDVAPGSLRVLWVVADAGDNGVVDRRVVEGVQGAAVDREAPVDAR